ADAHPEATWTFAGRLADARWRRADDSADRRVGVAFTHPGGVRRFAQPGAIAPPDVKCSFWSSMADLGRLVMRSQAKGLRTRLVLAIGLVVLGKWAGVNAPVFLGEAVNALTDGHHQPGALGMVFLGLAGAFVGLRF